MDVTRLSCCKYIRTDRAETRKYAANHGVANAFQKFKQKFSVTKQQRVFAFKRKYLELKSTDPSQPASKIQAKMDGHSSFLPDNLMTKTVDINKALRVKAPPISYSGMAGVARGVVLSYDRNLLVENGGHLSFPDDWGRCIIYKVTKHG